MVNTKISQIEEYLFVSVEEERIAHLGALAEITEMMYFALHAE